MQNPQVKFTYRDYLQLPEQDRRELIDGDLYVVPSPSVKHQAVSANLGVAIRDFVQRNRLGVVLWAPMDVMLSNEDVVQPDILFVSNERREIITEDNISLPFSELEYGGFKDTVTGLVDRSAFRSGQTADAVLEATTADSDD